MIRKEVEIKSLILLPVLKVDSNDNLLRAKKDEAIGLANTLELKIIDSIIIRLDKFRPGYLFGKGKIDEIKNICKQNDVELVYIDASITPVQQRNLERSFGTKVIDRTGIILEIFANHARSSEGKLQVRLAYLQYQRTRLVRMWTHLERQRGGLGTVGGPGETQLESDRRIIKEEITKIKKKLEKVRRTRSLHRKSREIVPYPVVAIVGYTNAGKSTLFNLLTKSNVLAESKLFATLDPSMRILKLPSRKKVIISDTVGFIADLPTELVAAFRATLEEVVEADIILHVQDASSPMVEKQAKDVEKVIKSLGLEEKWMNNTIHVYNKIDLLEDTSHLPKNAIKISSTENRGIDKLLDAIDKKLMKNDIRTRVVINSDEAERISWLYRNANVISVKYEEDKVVVEMTISPNNLEKWRKHEYRK